MSKRILVVYRNFADVGPYAEALESVGLVPRLADVGLGVEMEGAAGLLLTGGTDVDPAKYGELAGPETEAPDGERDEVEGKLIQEALRRDLPVLGICRGLQMLNVELGGTLTQHLERAEAHVRRTADWGAAAHEVAIEPGTRLAEIAGCARWQVNSRHHQAIRRLGAGLKVSARDAVDGTIEAVEMPWKRYVVAVQWHPENQCHPGNRTAGYAEQRKLFLSFAQAV